MPTRQEWLETVYGIREGRDPLRSPDIPRLYDLAIRDGEQFLQRQFRGIPAADRADHVHDVLARNLQALVAADNPRALFLVCLRHRAISLLRGERKSSNDDRSVEPTEAAGPPRVELSESFAILLDTTSPRDVAVFFAVVAGDEDVDAVAATFGVSVANVYTIVSRLRRKLRAATGRGL